MSLKGKKGIDYSNHVSAVLYQGEKTALFEIEEQLKAGLEYIDTIRNARDNEVIGDNVHYLVHDYSNLEERFGQNTEVLEWLKTLERLRQRMESK